MKLQTAFFCILLCLTGLLSFFGCSDSEEPSALSLLNVSYDPTRELYQALNKAFVEQCDHEGLSGVVVEQSHGGSGKQARAVLDGLEADVVTLALGYDIDVLCSQGHLIPADWQSRLPHNSSPFYSTIVFLVRRGNPKGIADWGDLIHDGVEVITPNPKTSGGARWNYLAAWAWAERKYGSEAAAQDFLATLFSHVPVLDTGARGATNTFIQQGKGDVLLAWENEALLVLRDYPDQGCEIVHPSLSIRAEPPVALVDANADAHGSRSLAEKYLNFLYTDTAQAIGAAQFYRPIRPEAAAAEDMARFRPLAMVSIDDFGGWSAAHAKHFAADGIYDHLPRKRNP